LFRLKSPIKYYLFCKIKNTEFSGTFYFGLSDSSVLLCKKLFLFIIEKQNFYFRKMKLPFSGMNIVVDGLLKPYLKAPFGAFLRLRNCALD
jgi:hypothetical protein